MLTNKTPLCINRCKRVFDDSPKVLCFVVEITAKLMYTLNNTWIGIFMVERDSINDKISDIWELEESMIS